MLGKQRITVMMMMPTMRRSRCLLKKLDLDQRNQLLLQAGLRRAQRQAVKVAKWCSQQHDTCFFSNIILYIGPVRFIFFLLA